MHGRPGGCPAGPTAAPAVDDGDRPLSAEQPPRVAVIRVTALVGAAGLLGAGSNVLILPAAIVGLLAAAAGIRRLGDDLDAAGLRLGVAVLVSAIVAPLAFLSGDGMLATAALMALSMFVFAWTACDRLRRHRRRAWGGRQRQLLDRQAQLRQRQHALRDRPRVGREDGAP